MKIKILGYKWYVGSLSKKKFNKRFKKCKAITELDKKRIYFREDVINELYVVHELVHAFNYYCCKEEIDFTQDQYEEYMCDFVAIHSEQILKLSKRILKRLR